MVKLKYAFIAFLFPFLVNTDVLGVEDDCGAVSCTKENCSCRCHPTNEDDICNLDNHPNLAGQDREWLQDRLADAECFLEQREGCLASTVHTGTGGGLFTDAEVKTMVARLTQVRDTLFSVVSKLTAALKKKMGTTGGAAAASSSQ